ncbi:glycosyltransferase family 4 protein [Lachnospiraceae bacterium 46-61]
MNIGLFTDTYFPQINGVATSVHTLAGALRARGHNVYIFTPKDPNITAEQSSENVIAMPSLPFMLLRNYRVGLIYSPRAFNQISHLHLDIVHTQTEFPLGIFGKLLSTVKKIPMVHTYHTMYEDYVHYIAKGYIVTPAMAKEFSKLFCNSATAVVAPTEKAKHFLEEYGVIKPIEIIPTGIDTSLFSKKNFSEQDTIALKQSLGLEKDTPVILSLGRVAKEKSIDVILRALPKLFQKMPQARMVIVGDGPERENLEHLAKELDIAHKVLFIGAKPWAEIGKYYQIGTVFCSASVSETQGLTFAEAMAGGIPVIAKRDESIENIIENNKTGLLFETEEDLTEKLYMLLNTPALQKRLSNASITKMELLSVSAFAEHMEQLYENTIDVYHSDTTQEHFAKRPLSVGVKTVKSISRLPKQIVKKGTGLLYLPLLHKNNTAHTEQNTTEQCNVEQNQIEYDNAKK